jgi:PEP-CTERM motif
MRRIGTALLAASALAFVAAPASAQVVTNYGPAATGVGDNPSTTDFNVFGDPFNGPVTATFSHGDITGLFTDNILFHIGADGLGSGDATTSLAIGGLGTAIDLDLYTVTINGMPVNGIYTNSIGQPCTTPNVGDCLNQLFTTSNVPIVADALNTITITGLGRGIGSYSGHLSFLPSGVPEPATWSMMLLGFGAVGFSMRRAKAKQLQQFA